MERKGDALMSMFGRHPQIAFEGLHLGIGAPLNVRCDCCARRAASHEATCHGCGAPLPVPMMGGAVITCDQVLAKADADRIRDAWTRAHTGYWR